VIRIGHGCDAHRFGEGDFIMLGGVKIPHEKGLIAHSDGDVLIHALCDALLGSAGLGDIGRHFPDSEDEFENIDSRVLLRQVVTLLKDKGCQVTNADVTVLAQAPKLAEHIPAMCKILATDLALDVSFINVKATTTEGMGFVGRSEGISVHAVVLIS